MRTSFGGVRDLTIGLKTVEADGAVTKSGGRVVKNVQGFDLVRLHIGAFGTLGVIAEAAFKLLPLPARTQTVAAWFDSLDWAREASMQLYNGRLLPEALTLSTGATARGLARDLGPGDELSETYLLLARVAGGAAAVRRQVENVTSTVGASMANGFEVLDDAETDRARELTGSGETPAVAARTTLKPTAAFDFVSRLERGESEVGLSLETSVHVGTGTVLASWSGDSLTIEQAMRAVELSVSSAQSCGGRAVIERCPAEAKQQIDVWNEGGGALDIMRSLKEQFDPRRTLSPGRFAGRI
jgi:glycolate oxidase FAD binding subunit